MPTPDITTLTADLRALGGQRVWSLMISLFGDLAQGKGDEIDGPVLSSIMGALEIRPEAARVALHRLRNDGWLTSVKSGRISRHSLTSKGRSESAAASPRIYAGPQDSAPDWQLILFQDTDAATEADLTQAGFSQILPRVFVGSAATPVPNNAIALPGGAAPAWLQEQAGPRALMQDYAKLHSSLTALSGVLPDPNKLSALDTAVLRCLIVHNWRRLILRHPMPPRPLISESSDFYRCHTVVAQLLAQFPRPALSAIAQDQASA